MVFSSITFLYIFLPTLIFIYIIAPKKLKNLVMFLASMVFFAWGEIRFIPVMLSLTVSDYICARMIDKHDENPQKRKMYMLIDVFTNLSVLLFFKYTNFFISNFNLIPSVNLPILDIILPIGVSFNVFQSISYIVDVYTRRTTSEKSYYNYITYTTLFPQIIAGPIVRYVTVEDDLDERKIKLNNMTTGLRRFIVGLGKKVLIANNIGLLFSIISAMPRSEMSVLTAWLGITAFAFQIYYDFSGYSDMAIGLAKIFGFDFDENFNYPYISKSITEFWRRWHMSLSSWFKDYVYIPLGGSRVSKLLNIRNIFIVWALTGLWHGASWNFIVWGIYYGIILLLEKFILRKYIEKLPNFLKHTYTIFLILIGWCIFVFEDLGSLGYYMKLMFGFGNIDFINSNFLYYFKNYILIFTLAIIFSTPIYLKIKDRIKKMKSADIIIL